jgi:PAS domain S-box-containing protein
MPLTVPELIPIPRLQKLMEYFHDATGIPVGIIGIEGEILVATGWQEICTEFHRCHPVTAERCRQSDDYIKSHLAAGEYVQYKCRNGLWDLAVPIIIADTHCATLFLGQFFYDDEAIDEAFFQRQADEFGFDHDRYLAALRRIPIFTREKVRRIMVFYTSFVDFLVSTGLTHHRQVVAEKTLILNEARLEALYRLNEMEEKTIHEITDFALDAAVRLTKSTIGYLAFTNDDETVLTMYSWSKGAMAACTIADKPLVYPVASTGLWGEAIRQRQPIITNDYAAPNPCKKGYPTGHVPVSRHMNVPIFDGDRIVVVAGVGNKEQEYDETDVRQLTLLMHGMWRLIQRKRMDDALRESEERYRRIVETAQEGIWLLDATMATTYVNQGMADILGYREVEMVGRPLFDFVDDSCREIVQSQIEQRKNGHKGKYEVVMLRKDGEKMWVSVSSSPIFDQSGTFSGAIAMLSDISVRKRMEEKLRASEETLRVTFNNAHDAIFIHELNGDIIDVNDKMLEMYGVDRDTAISLSITDHYSGPDNPLERVPVIWQKVIEGENQLFRWQARRIDDGSFFDAEVSLRRITLNQRHAILATVRDITERKRAEQEIECLNTNLAARAAELEAANRELEAFNYTVSHDLRTPLTGVKGYCELLQELCGNGLEVRCQGYIREILAAARHMDQLISTLLDFSRLTRSEFSREMVDLTGLATAIAGQLQMNDPHRSASFVIAENLASPGDTRLLRTVLENLLGNAWKYTGHREHAHIEFGTTILSGIRAYFVRDNGAGFDMADADKLFLPFKRLAGAAGCTGFGIGLATVERIIRRHGGQVWAEGAPDTGATFYFTLDRGLSP